MIEDDAALRMLSGLESSCLAVLTLADGRAVTEADLHVCLCLGQDRTLYVCVCVWWIVGGRDSSGWRGGGLIDKVRDNGRI